jgi:hypothetical protein
MFIREAANDNFTLFGLRTRTGINESMIDCTQDNILTTTSPMWLLGNETSYNIIFSDKNSRDQN